MLFKKTVALSIISVLMSTPAMAGDNPGSHQHGHANLQLAFNDNQVDLLFMSPAGNLLGFEHKPRTLKQKQEAGKVAVWLRESPLINTPESTCRVKAATVHHQTQDHNHDDGDAHGDQEQHADIEVTQVLICPGLNKSAFLTTPVSIHFPAVEYLDIAWAGPNGQAATRLEYGEHSFRLGR
ncbi:DUF2796 domain-containing protein [Marinobacter sp.]|uniref:ZrgA family zinc uptake protein n=1 Tax=Marinobacter sp. TaxID=50741 RepID=UPI001B58934E|nr:DUF2796 domain-containing protein [Marinobacter sp.]MBQ0832750.1 DUF2796 domain-containing protein [Marinobacter sp.]